MAYTYSPAVLALMARGLRPRDIGDRIGCSPATVSRQLTGQSPPHLGLIDALRLLAGSDLADMIDELIETKVGRG